MNDHPCAKCGSAYAPFGYGPAGVKLREQPHLFVWFCGDHRPEGKPPRAAPKPEETPVFECPF